jgi:oligopeptide transport system substrate-binding protein
MRVRTLFAGALLLAVPPALALSSASGERPAALTFVSGPEPETLDPSLASAVLETRILALLFEGLTAIDPRTLAPRLAAAERCETDGARRFRFTLREGLRFSDGTPLAAADFLYAWRRAAAPETGAPLAAEAAILAEAARAPDARTIEIALERPRPDLLALLALPAFAPLSRAALEAHGERWTRPGNLVGNGPFRLTAWDLGRRLRFLRNEHFRAAREVALDSIEALTTSGAVVGEGTAFQIYETGGADLVFDVPSGAAERLRGRPDFHEGPALRTVFLRFRCDRPPLDRPALRRALAAAIDRDALAARVLRNGERPARSLVPPAFPGFVPSREVAAEEPAPERPPPLELVYASADEAAANVAEVLQAEWGRRLGVALRLRPMERKAFYGAVRRGEYQIAFGNWVADFPDPSNFLEIMRGASGNNRTGWADARYDALLDRAAEATGEARTALLREAEALLAREAPIAPLWHGRTAVLCRERIAGFFPNASNLVDWAALAAKTP